MKKYTYNTKSLRKDVLETLKKRGVWNGKDKRVTIMLDSRRETFILSGQASDRKMKEQLLAEQL